MSPMQTFFVTCLNNDGARVVVSSSATHFCAAQTLAGRVHPSRRPQVAEHVCDPVMFVSPMPFDVELRDRAIVTLRTLPADMTCGVAWVESEAFRGVALELDLGTESVRDTIGELIAFLEASHA